MSFSNEIKIQAYERAGGRCECVRKQCSHEGRCQKECATEQFFINLRISKGEEPDFGEFEFHHKTAESIGGENVLSNCEFLCEECHEHTRSYGRHN